MPTRNVNLTAHFDQFIEAGVQAGKYSNASEIVREGLRLLEQRDSEDTAKVEWLRGAVDEGLGDLAGGEFVVVRSREEVRGFLQQVREEAFATSAASSTTFGLQDANDE